MYDPAYHQHQIKILTYLFSLPLQHIQNKAMIINATKTPPNATKNIPKEVSSGENGDSRGPGCSVLVTFGRPVDVANAPAGLSNLVFSLAGCIKGSTTTEEVVMLSEVKTCVRFGEITVVALLSIAVVQYEPREDLDEELIIVGNVIELESRRPKRRSQNTTVKITKFEC